MQHATCNTQHATRNMQHTTCNMQHATCLQVVNDKQRPRVRAQHACQPPPRRPVPHDQPPSPVQKMHDSIPGGTASAQYPRRHGMPADKPDARRGGRHTPRAAACAGLQRERRWSGQDFIGFRSVRCCASGERRRCARMSAELQRAGTLLMLRSHLMRLIVQCRNAAMPPCCAGCDPRRVVLCMCSVPFVLRGCMPRAMLPAEGTLHAACHVACCVPRCMLRATLHAACHVPRRAHAAIAQRRARVRTDRSCDAMCTKRTTGTRALATTLTAAYAAPSRSSLSAARLSSGTDCAAHLCACVCVSVSVFPRACLCACGACAWACARLWRNRAERARGRVGEKD